MNVIVSIAMLRLLVAGVGILFANFGDGGTAIAQGRSLTVGAGLTNRTDGPVQLSSLR